LAVSPPDREGEKGRAGAALPVSLIWAMLFLSKLGVDEGCLLMLAIGFDSSPRWDGVKEACGLLQEAIGDVGSAYDPLLCEAIQE
jgi:hypothetical protein